MIDTDFKQELRKLLYEVNHLESRLETLLNETGNKVVTFTYLTREEAANFYGISMRQFDRIVTEYMIPHQKNIRGKYLYLKADLINAMSFMTVQQAREYRTLGFVRGECDADGRPVPKKDTKKSKYLKLK